MSVNCQVVAIIGPELNSWARELNLGTQSDMSSILGLGDQFLDIIGPELSCQALGSNLWIQRVMSSIPGHGVKVGGKKRTKNVRFWMIEGWDGAHCLAFLEAPHFDVKHLEIGQETKKLGPLPPKCHEFESRTRQWSFSHHWPKILSLSQGIEPKNHWVWFQDSAINRHLIFDKTNFYLT